MEGYGVIQKEYVAVADKLLADVKAMKKYFAISLEYVRSLKPKPTAGKTSGKKKMIFSPLNFFQSLIPSSPI